MRTLVINLTRFGDLLQTQPVFSGLKSRGHEVGLVCLQNFLPAAQLVRNLDKAFAIPGARLLAELDQAWPLALGECLGFVEDVRREFPPDQVINLTPSLPARLLARSLASGEVLGFGLDEFGFGSYSSAWAGFLEATARFRGSSPFNVADLFFKAAHLGDAAREFQLADPSADDLSAVQEIIASQTHVPFSGLVGLQLGASAAKRQWPTESFATVAKCLWEKHGLLPVLLGSKAEEPLAQAFGHLADIPHVNLVGRTGLGQLAAAVSLLRILVTNDTGTMHLAAGLSVPVLAIFLATAQPFDTGPYLPGACCLEPDMDCHPCSFSHDCQTGWVCRKEVQPEAALAYLDGYLASGKWPEFSGLGVRAWESVQDKHGFLDLHSLSGHGDAARSVWNAIQRCIWRRFLDGEPQEFVGNEAEALPEEFKTRLFGILSQARGLLDVLLQQARVLEVAPRPAMRSKFMATWQNLESLFSSEPALCALAHLWLHLSQVESRDLKRFSRFVLKVTDLVSSLSSLLAYQR